MSFRYECGHLETDATECEICALRARILELEAQVEEAKIHLNDCRNDVRQAEKVISTLRETAALSSVHPMSNSEEAKAFNARGESEV